MAEEPSRNIIDRGNSEVLVRKCPQCEEILCENEVVDNLEVCPRCKYHYPIKALARLKQLFDDEKFELLFEEVLPLDPLNFVGDKSYREKLIEITENIGVSEAIIVGKGFLDGILTIITAMDFGFLGGSMGSVVGERFVRAVELAVELKVPLIAVNCSGGARMQEGMLSLMQMAKTASAVQKLHQSRLPFISVLTNPTMAGVLASFASLGDVLIAEPGALIGFTGPRVIEQTIGKKLPPGFQRAEFLLQHGFIDLVVERTQLKLVISQLLRLWR